MRPRSHSLKLPRPGLPVQAPRRSRLSLRRRPRARWRQAGLGILLLVAGCGILAVLMALPSRLDALLLVSNAIANLIRGLMQLGQALVQLTVVLIVVLLALLALLLLIGGAVRLLRAVVPGRDRTPGAP